MDNLKTEKKRESWFLYAKLTVINVVIILFGLGVWHLLSKAVDQHDAVIVGELVPLMITVIGLVTLEINQIFKHLKFLREWRIRYDKEIMNQNKTSN